MKLSLFQFFSSLSIFCFTTLYIIIILFETYSVIMNDQCCCISFTPNHVRLFIAQHFDSSSMLIRFQFVLTQYSVKLKHCITNQFNEEKRNSCEQTDRFMIPTTCAKKINRSAYFFFKTCLFFSESQKTLQRKKKKSFQTFFSEKLVIFYFLSSKSRKKVGARVFKRLRSGYGKHMYF